MRTLGKNLRTKYSTKPMDEVRITTLKSTLGNVGTAQTVGPGTPEGSSSLHTSPADPTHAVVGTQITDQVLQQ